MIINKSEYLNHIKDENQILVLKNVIDKVERVLKYHCIESTDFLNPYQRRLCYSILNRFMDIKYIEQGGYKKAERKVIIIYPQYMATTEINIPISAIQIAITSEFSNLKHKDFLGALMSLGLRREKIGDIVLHKEYGQILIDSKIKDFVLFNLKKIGNKRIKIKEVKINEVKRSEEKFKTKFISVPSNRLDCIVSSVFNIPRSKSSNIIKNERVKVNWEPITKSSHNVEEGDLISVRKKGRFIINQNLGTSKKGRYKLNIKLYT